MNIIRFPQNTFQGVVSFLRKPVFLNQVTPCYSTESDVKCHPDDPDVLPKDPYRKPIKRCIICEHNIPLGYKNVQLLSQYVSPYTGRMYGRHITKLCRPMQKNINRLIIKSRTFGFMPYECKETRFLQDPKLMRSPMPRVTPLIK